VFPEYPSIATWRQRECENVAYLMRSVLHWANVVWEYCIRYVTQSTATRSSHVMVSMLCSVSNDCRPASSVPEVCLGLHRHYKSCLGYTATGFATDTKLARYLALLFTSSWEKISSLWDQHVACLFASVCLLTACLSVYSLVPHFKFQSTVRFSQHRYEHCSIKSHPKLPHLISYSR
jgi:hypothetical protein